MMTEKQTIDGMIVKKDVLHQEGQNKKEFQAMTKISLQQLQTPTAVTYNRIKNIFKKKKKKNTQQGEIDKMDIDRIFF